MTPIEPGTSTADPTGRAVHHRRLPRAMTPRRRRSNRVSGTHTFSELQWFIARPAAIAKTCVFPPANTAAGRPGGMLPPRDCSDMWFLRLKSCDTALANAEALKERLLQGCHHRPKDQVGSLRGNPRSLHDQLSRIHICRPQTRLSTSRAVAGTTGSAAADDLYKPSHRPGWSHHPASQTSFARSSTNQRNATITRSPGSTTAPKALCSR